MVNRPYPSCAPYVCTDSINYQVLLEIEMSLEYSISNIWLPSYRRNVIYEHILGAVVVKHTVTGLDRYERPGLNLMVPSRVRRLPRVSAFLALSPTKSKINYCRLLLVFTIGSDLNCCVTLRVRTP